MSLSQIARSIKPSPTLALNEKAAILREKGDPVIHLGGGTDPNIKAEIIQNEDAKIQSCLDILDLSVF